MAHDLIISSVCFLSGVAARLLFVLVSYIQKRTLIRPVTIALDLILCAVIILPLSLFFIHYNDGVVLPYMFIMPVVGYVAMSLIK